MDRDRLENGGSLLNKAYEMQCQREREFAMMDMMGRIDLHQTGPLSSEDRLFMSASVGRPQSAPAVAAPAAALQSAPAPAVVTCVGGRMVSQQQYPVNGQQLQMQLDQLTSAMTDMTTNDDEMEMPSNPVYEQYIQERLETQPTSNPFSQEDKRRDPVYLSSMAAHSPSSSAPSSPGNNAVNTSAVEHEQQQKLEEEQQKQQYFMAFLQQQQITQQQFFEQQQYYLQLLEHQYAHHKQLELQQQQIQQQQLEQQQQLQLQIQAVVIPTNVMSSTDEESTRPRLMKRPDLIPIQKCSMWI